MFGMSRVCELTGKGKLKGNKVSHSNIKTIKHSKPSLRKTKVKIDGKKTTLKLSIKAYKSVKRGKVKNIVLAS